MPMVLDHVFICTGVGAPAAGKLSEFGLQEGAPNRHSGQGTACRRFFFRNAMLELLWVADAEEAQGEQARALRLRERWSASGRGASPFGVILRPAAGAESPIPFASWEYRPAAMPDLVLHIASGTRLDEPMWCYNQAGRRPDEAPAERRQPLDHPVGFREITGVGIRCPAMDGADLTQAMARAGAISLETGRGHTLELEFDGNRNGNRADFAPGLPLVFRW